MPKIWMNLLGELDIVFLQNILNRSGLIKSMIFSSADKISSDRLSLTYERENRIWFCDERPNTDETACTELPAQRRMDRHAASLRKTCQEHPLRIKRIFLRNLFIVKTQIGEPLTYADCVHDARSHRHHSGADRYEHRPGPHGYRNRDPTSPNYNTSLCT